MKKAFVCIHGFGNHPGGRHHGYSHKLRDGVKALLGDGIVWEEVLWDDLLGSPSSMTPVCFVRELPSIVRAFYQGEKGEAIRSRVADAIDGASEKAGGAPVVVVGHSMGGAIAYETLAGNGVLSECSLVMLAPPMGLFNEPGEYLRNALRSKGHGLDGLVGRLGLDHLAKGLAHFPHVKGGRLPETIPAIYFSSPGDWLAEPLGEEFYDVSALEAKPPRGTHGVGNHRFYWKSPEVAASVAAAAVRAASDAGVPPATEIEMKLLARAVNDSLFTPERVEVDEDGEECFVTS